MAVIVQRMVSAEAAGVAFTANPVTGDGHETIINAVRGLGERLVSGQASPDEWVVRDEERACVLIRCRGGSYVVEVENVTGPETYLAKNVTDAGPQMRGVAGVARLPGGKRAAVLDVYPWIETYQERMSDCLEEKRAVDARQDVSATDDRYIVFRVAGRRYAVPFAAVKTLGRVESEFLIMGMVDTKKGAFHLRDMREALGVEGEAGTVFVVLETPSGPVAWIVDGIEPILTMSQEQLNERLHVAPFGFSHRGGRVQGLIRAVIPSLRSPINMLNLDKLIPAGRPLRRFA